MVGTGGPKVTSKKGGIEMIRMEHSVVINRPIEEVFAFVTDIEKMSRWTIRRSWKQRKSPRAL